MDHLITQYSLGAQYTQVIRDVSAEADLPRTLHVDYYVGTLAGVTPSALNAGLTRPDQTPLDASAGDSAFDASMFDGSTVPIDVAAQWTRLPAPPAGGDAHLEWRKISMQFQVNGSERRIRRRTAVRRSRRAFELRCALRH